MWLLLFLRKSLRLSPVFYFFKSPSPRRNFYSPGFSNYFVSCESFITEKTSSGNSTYRLGTFEPL